MAFRISGATDPANNLDFELPIDGKPAEFYAVTLPMIQYVSRALAKDSDKWIEDQTALALEGKAAEPTNLDLMDFLLRKLDARAAKMVDAMTSGQRQEFWNYWNGNSKINLGESGASSDS